MRATSKIISTAGVIALTVGALTAQGRGRQRNPERQLGPVLAVAADKDKDGEVTRDEWTALTKAVAGAEAGQVDATKLKSVVIGSMLDTNADGKLDDKDFAAFLKQLDKDGDGAVSSEEMSARRQRGSARRGSGEGGDQRGRNRGRRGGEGEGAEGKAGEGGQRQQQSATAAGRYRRQIAPMFARAADADKSGDVTAEEWMALLGGQKKGEDGAVNAAAVADMLMAKGKAQPAEKAVDGEEGGQADGERRGRRSRNRGAGGLTGTLDRLLKPSEEGLIEAEKIEKVFADLDKDGDGVLTKEEIRPARRNRRRR